jgi:predicted transcriptional regulator
MTMTIKSGSLSEFFNSVKQTAKEIDARQTPSPKHTVWMDTDDLAALLKPQRKALLSYLRDKEEITLDELVTALHRSAKSLTQDLSLLSKYELVHVLQKQIPRQKIIRPTFTRETLEFIARV